MRLTERTCLKHKIFILNRKRDFHFVNIQILQEKASSIQDGPWCVSTVILCMCTIFRTTMTNLRVHLLGHFSSNQRPGSKTSYIHVCIHANGVVYFTCANWHKKHRNQTNHQYQHVVAVEKNSTVIICTHCNRWSVESMQRDMPCSSRD